LRRGSLTVTQGDTGGTRTRGDIFLKLRRMRPISRLMRYALILALFTLALRLRAAAPDEDLTSLSLEDFLKVEVVSVRKSQQKLSRTPAAVHVITQEDIRRSGALSLPEALRLAPGVHVARVNGSLWAVGMRGSNHVSSNELLVMIDGRTIYNPIMSGVIWQHQMIPLEDVERIEVIRGPAGSMWGANAVNGVINVISKHTSATQGALVAASGGSMDPASDLRAYDAMGAIHGAVFVSGHDPATMRGQKRIEIAK